MGAHCYISSESGLNRFDEIYFDLLLTQSGKSIL